MHGLLGLRDLPADRLVALLDAAAAFRTRVRAGESRFDLHSGRAVALLFLEASTRTRFSFEMACKRLGADALVFSAAASSTTKGETLLDTVRTLRAIGADALVIRHSAVGAAHLLSHRLGIPVINAGDGTAEHPTQALLDLLTLRDRFGTIRGLTVAIVGDILHSRVARSNLFALPTLGARVLLAGPPTLVPAGWRDRGIEVRHTIDEVLPDADAVMMLRIQRERLGHGMLGSDAEYRAGYALTADRAALLRPDAVVMHPAPMNRGIEIDDTVADGPRSLVFPQMENGVFVRMAALDAALGGAS